VRRRGQHANTSRRSCLEAANDDAFGGYGLASEYGIERKFREARLYIVAPVSNNLVLAHVGQHVLGLPRSF
jgi:alkylation response protein AidB-like acyl-CoA dehydrogenase